MNRFASSPVNWDPLVGTSRSDEVSYLWRVSGGSSMIRCSITGTIGTVVTR